MSNTLQILMVDDCADIREIATLCLELTGDYCVTTAHDGIEALECVHSKEPDLILLDVMMPRMNGVECMEQLRLRFPHIPVIFFTSQVQADHIERYRQSGAIGLLSKPIIPLSFVQSLRHITAHPWTRP